MSFSMGVDAFVVEATSLAAKDRLRLSPWLSRPRLRYNSQRTLVLKPNVRKPVIVRRGEGALHLPKYMPPLLATCDCNYATRKSLQTTRRARLARGEPLNFVPKRREILPGVPRCRRRLQDSICSMTAFGKKGD